MTRLSELLNRLELIAKRAKMSIEDLVLILEGGHPTHEIAVKSDAPETTEAFPANPTTGSATPVTGTASQDGSISAPAAETETPATASPSGTTKAP